MRRVKLYPSKDTMLDLTLEPAETLPNRNVQALWFVCCATGNRPTNLYDANFEVTASCLAVTFPKRKVRSKGRESLEFPWRWSSYPPPFICNILAEVAARYPLHPHKIRKTGWCLHCDGTDYAPSDYDVGSRVISYLRSKGMPWMSTTPRDVMSTSLHPLVGIDPDLPNQAALENLSTTRRQP
jgi:hypothetical protein